MNNCHLIISNYNKNLCWLKKIEKTVDKIYV